MPFSWREFIDIARFLQSHGNSAVIPAEAAYRCAISRTYYAAFCHAKTHASMRGFKEKGTSDDHIDLRLFFIQKGRRDISRRLDDLRQWRNHCDYFNPTPTATDSNVSIAIKRAEEVITRCPLP